MQPQGLRTGAKIANLDLDVVATATAVGIPILCMKTNVTMVRVWSASGSIILNIPLAGTP